MPAALLASGKLPYEVYIVHTGSMSPTIPPRSAVIVKKGVYHVGQVISFESPNGVVTHRLIRRTAAGTLVTKGDANKTADPGTTAPAQVIGGVVAAPRMLGYWLQYLKDPAGLASLFMLIVCFWLIYSITVELPRASRRRRRGSRGARRGSAGGQRRAALAVRRRRPRGPSQRRDAAAPGIAAAVAPAIGYERPAAVWQPVVKGAPVVFRCWRCGDAFADTDELHAHVLEHHATRRDVRLPLVPAVSVVTAPAIGHERPVAVWKPVVVKGAPVVFRCWRCGDAFADTDELMRTSRSTTPLAATGNGSRLPRSPKGEPLIPTWSPPAATAKAPRTVSEAGPTRHVHSVSLRGCGQHSGPAA